jgi:hypothetical protein
LPGYVGFRWELFWLEREQRRLGKKHIAALKAAKLRKASADEIYVIDDDGAGDYFYIQDEIRKLHSRYLCSQTSRLLLPLPATSDETMWEKEGANYIYLTEHGINHLRAAIRAERKARVELFLMWMPGVVGILGALIGLAAILMQKK